MAKILPLLGNITEPQETKNQHVQLYNRDCKLKRNSWRENKWKYVKKQCMEFVSQSKETLTSKDVSVKIVSLLVVAVGWSAQSSLILRCNGLMKIASWRSPPVSESRPRQASSSSIFRCLPFPRLRIISCTVRSSVPCVSLCFRYSTAETTTWDESYVHSDE